MKPNNHIAAFFDFDETLLDVESGRLGIQWLWDRRLVPFGYILKILVANFLYQRRLLSDERGQNNADLLQEKTPGRLSKRRG
jgi:phosphoserine phosphatase